VEYLKAMFIDLFNQFIQVSQELENELTSKICKINVPKNYILLKKGEVGKYLYLIERGIVMGYHSQRGKEICLYFATENELFTSAYSLISKKPSFENIMALEDCIIHSLPRKDLYSLYDKFPEMNIVGRQLVEQYFLEIEERLNAIQFQNAKQRYRNFLLAEAHLLDRISLGRLASYLGMSQETLSRIRKQHPKK
jgi:CRP/FNR family transcriptional regulator, anaerobic regulatory protein